MDEGAEKEVTDLAKVFDMVEGRDDEPDLPIDRPSRTSLSRPTTAEGVTHIPNMAYDCLVACLAKKLGNRRVYRRVATACMVGGDRYSFEAAMTEHGILVRMTRVVNAVRLAAVPTELQAARTRSGEAHQRLTRCQGQLEQEKATAAPILARTDENKEWADGTYSAGQKRASQEEREMVEGRVAKAANALVVAEMDAQKAREDVERLTAELSGGNTEFKVWTLEDVENGKVLPKYRVLP